MISKYSDEDKIVIAKLTGTVLIMVCDIASANCQMSVETISDNLVVVNLVGTF